MLNTTKLSRRWRWTALIFLLVAAFYFTSWGLRRRLGLIHPMANLAYYHYGSAPNSFADRALYWIYYPIYRCGDRYGIHWKDRADGYDPFQF